MRKCVVIAVAALAALSFAMPSQVSAQGVFVGVGGTMPTGDYADFGDGDGANAGWAAAAGLVFPMGDAGLSFLVNGMYGSNSHDHEGDKTNLLGGFGGVQMSFADPGTAGPFVFGQVGFLKHSYKSDEHSEYEDSSSGLALGGGAGFSFPMGETLNGWVLGHYLHGLLSDDETGEGDTTLLGVMVGVTIPFGG
jgi:hypothetical protein